jgi:RNA polymerase sigma factor (sigma-70 family)
MAATGGGGEGAQSDITRLLLDWRDGDRRALDRLIPQVYDELRRLAGRYVRREPPDSPLQPTALIAVAARQMRRILVDQARERRAAKRGGGAAPVTLVDDALAGGEPVAGVDLLALDAALGELANLDPRQAELVELRFFAGMTVPETAAALGISPATVKREWALAKAWLYRKLNER